MPSPWQLAAAAMRCLRDVVAAVDRAADGVAQAAGLLARLVRSTVRLLRALLTILRTLATGCRAMAVLLVGISISLAQFRTLFSPTSCRRYRQEYRREERRAAKELRRRERDMAFEAAVQEGAQRHGAQPPFPPQHAPGRRHRGRRPRRNEDSDGYPSSDSPSGSTPGSADSWGSTFFSAAEEWATYGSLCREMLRMQVEDIRLSLLEAKNAMEVVEFIVGLPAEKRELVIILLWDWWSARNKKNVKEKVSNPEAVCHRIQRHVLDFGKHGPARDAASSSNAGTTNPESCKWKKPERDKVKINFDAAFHESTGVGAWGFIARSDTGQFVTAVAGKLQNVKDALAAEAEACVAATEGAAAIGLHRVCLESDCKTLISALQSRSHDLAPIGVLLKEVRSICIASFESYEFMFAPRSCNTAAHLLAQHGLRADIACMGWEDVPPVCVTEVVASEAAVHPE